MRFSVIVPVYQGEKYIDRCLKSILGQKSGGCGFEVIIVDDGSTDATAEICRRYSEQDSRVKVIRRSENRGLVAARSEGVSAAKGEYILFVDADDYVLPGWLQKTEAASETGPDMILFNAVAVYADRSIPYSHNIYPGLYTKDILEEKIYPYLIVNSRFGYQFNDVIRPTMWSKCCRKSLLEQHLVTDERITMMEDFCMTTECALYADSIMVIPDCLYVYDKTNTGSMGATMFGDPLGTYVHVLDYLRGRLTGFRGDTDVQLDILAVMFVVAFIRMECRKGKPYRAVLSSCRASIESSGIRDRIRMQSLPGPVRETADSVIRRRYDSIVKTIYRGQDPFMPGVAGRAAVLHR